MPLWSCPNGCGSVRGGKRPRRDDVVRYCLPCSTKSGRLVERVVVAAKPTKKRQSRPAKTAALTFPDGKKPDFYLLYGRLSVTVRQSMRPRASIISRTGVDIYDFGGDEFDRRATVVLAEQRYYAARGVGLFGQAMKTFVRRNIEKTIGVRLRLESMKDAEKELANLLRARAALKTMESA